MPEPRYVWLVLDIDISDERTPVIVFDRQQEANALAESIGGAVERVLFIEIGGE